jgi:hypothetical protein
MTLTCELPYLLGTQSLEQKNIFHDRIHYSSSTFFHFFHEVMKSGAKTSGISF